MEAKSLFTKLSSIYRSFLISLINNKSNLSQYVISLYENATNERRNELNQIFGYLKNSGYLSVMFADDRAYVVTLTYEGKNYLELEKEYSEQSQNGKINHYNFYGNGQIQLGDNNTATQINYVNTDDLDDTVSKIKLLLNTIPSDLRGIINDNIDVLHGELKNEKPNKGLIKTAIHSLKDASPKILKAIELTAEIATIIQFAMAVL